MTAYGSANAADGSAAFGTRSRVGTFFDSQADTWLDHYKAEREFRARERLVGELLRRASDRTCNVLDVGCGPGSLLPVLRQSLAAYLGIDISAEMIRRGEQHARSLGLHRLATFRLYDGKRLPADDATYDVVLCISVLEYVDAPSAMLAEIARVLAPGGTLIASVPNGQSLLRRCQRAIVRLGNALGLAWAAERCVSLQRHLWSASALTADVQMHGFRVEELLPYGAPRFVARRLPHLAARLEASPRQATMLIGRFTSADAAPASHEPGA